MLLSELVGVKHLQHLTLDQLLDKYGIKVVGAGKYGQVLSHPSWDYVVKLFSNDPAYLAYIDFVISHPNPNFPKFTKKPFQLHQFQKRSANEAATLWAVRIEKLNTINDKKLLAFIVRNLESGATTLFQKEDPSSSYNRMPKTVPLVQPDGSLAYGMTFKELFNKFPWFESLCSAYGELLIGLEQGCPDIHSGNFMQRAGGTIVITDPVWEGSNPYKEYDSWYKTETDYYGNEEDPEQIQGPLYKNRKPTENKVKQPAQPSDDYDDIPF